VQFKDALLVIISVLIFAVPLSSIQVAGYGLILCGIIIYNVLRTDKAAAVAEARPPAGFASLLRQSAASPLVWVIIPTVIVVYLVGVVGVRVCIVSWEDRVAAVAAAEAAAKAAAVAAAAVE
jgi:hypothetical protein